MPAYLTERDLRAVTEAVASAVRLDDDQLARLEAAVQIALGNSSRVYACLRPAQRKMVDLLWSQHPRTVPYDAILDLIARPDTSPDTVKTQKAKLGRLRPDLGDCVLTVWGEGLRWEGPDPAELEAAFLAREAAAV